MSSLTAYPADSALQHLARELPTVRISDALAADPDRASRYCLQAAGISFDFAKQMLDDRVVDELLALAQQAQLSENIAALFHGEHLNHTERRGALHHLLRASSAGNLDELYSTVASTREQMRAWTDSLNSGELLGFSGAAITDVVNIGIGGSDLGPRLVVEALAPYRGPVASHFVANVDPADIQDTLLNLNPETTLFIVCSKSFRTQETLANAKAAREWLLQAGASDSDVGLHFLAATTNIEAALELGIPSQHCLPMWDWVGGRYSLWSAVGLSIAVAVGWENFSALLHGAEAMDLHFRDTTARDNLPLMAALIDVWNRNYLGSSSQVVLPYSHGLQRLPEFLQQLTMESNGKRVDRQGETLSWASAPVLWGAPGTLGQHSFHQWLHQGTDTSAVEFVLPLTTHTGMAEQHQALVANCLAQSRALMVGRSAEQARASLQARNEDTALAAHLHIPGNRPNSVISLDAVTPQSLGALLAFYEHRTVCAGLLWQINPFDQWGVELGKEISSEITASMATRDSDSADPATQRLLAAWRAAQASSVDQRE